MMSDSHSCVSHETIHRLEQYQELVEKWQSRINLIGPSTLADFRNRHIEDSLQLLDYIPQRATVMDIGTGAGLPGVVLSIAGIPVTLVESDARKIIFLREVIRQLKLTAVTFHGRMESVPPQCVTFFTSRACSSLTQLFQYSSHVAPDAECLFHKGKNYSTEIEEAKRGWSFEYLPHPSRTDAQGVILHIRKLRKLT